MKEKIKIFLLIIITILIIGGLFYWYEWRPSKIKHDCSWVKKHSDAIPAKLAVSGPSEEEIKALQEEINICRATKHQTFACLNLQFEKNEQAQRAQPAQPAQPVKDWWEKANKEEYDFCIHDKGL